MIGILLNTEGDVWVIKAFREFNSLSVELVFRFDKQSST